MIEKHMRASQIFEMNIPRDRAIAITENLEDQINSHLLKLFGMTADDGTRSHWKAEVRAWFGRLASFRMKNRGKQKGKPLSAKVYYDHLYDHMYGGHEIENISSVLDLLVRDWGYTRNEVPVSEIAPKLRGFHLAISLRMANGQSYEDLLAQL
jgi:hypothetical protein